MSLYKNDQLKYVQLAVESILNQTYKDFDFYIQYDGFVTPEVDEYLSSLKDERVNIYKRRGNIYPWFHRKAKSMSLSDSMIWILPQYYYLYLI